MNHHSRNRWQGWEAGLHWTSARTLYNLADACWFDHVDGAAERVARAVRHEGPVTARWVWLSLLWLDWAPLLRGEGARFWRLDRSGRARCAARWANSRLRKRRELHDWVKSAVVASSTDAHQSSSGA